MSCSRHTLVIANGNGTLWYQTEMESIRLSCLRVIFGGFFLYFPSPDCITCSTPLSPPSLLVCRLMCIHSCVCVCVCERRHSTVFRSRRKRKTTGECFLKKWTLEGLLCVFLTLWLVALVTPNIWNYTFRLKSNDDRLFAVVETQGGGGGGIKMTGQTKKKREILLRMKISFSWIFQRFIL